MAGHGISSLVAGIYRRGGSRSKKKSRTKRDLDRHFGMAFANLEGVTVEVEQDNGHDIYRVQASPGDETYIFWVVVTVDTADVALHMGPEKPGV